MKEGKSVPGRRNHMCLFQMVKFAGAVIVRQVIIEHSVRLFILTECPARK